MGIILYYRGTSGGTGMKKYMYDAFRKKLNSSPRPAVTGLILAGTAAGCMTGFIIAWITGISVEMSVGSGVIAGFVLMCMMLLNI